MKVGLVVGKNVGNAVVRNKTKRRLRECARARVGDLPEGAILVIRALPAAAIVDFAQLSADLARSLGRVLGAPVAGSAKR